MKLNLKKIKITDNSIRRLPKEIGIYVFWFKNTPIYIGKSVNIRERVKSYFSKSIWGKTMEMVKNSTDISYLSVYSEFEALILEAYLIKKFKPKYNVDLKDDKSSLFIQITNDVYPMIKVVRESNIKSNDFWGPFQSSSDIKNILSQLRRIFPYSTHKPTKRACIYSQIGLCNPCPSIIESEKDTKIKNSLIKQYQTNIKSLKYVLNGNLNHVRNSLIKEMILNSKKENYQKALEIRRKIDAFYRLSQKKFPIEGYLKNPNFTEDIRISELESLKDLLKPYFNIRSLSRIECYDVSHFQGSFATASMVVFTNGREDKANYRHFKINQEKKQSDTDSLKEVIERRIKHFKSWGKPDLIIVDGGKGQTSVFDNILNKYSIPVVGLAKRKETLIIYDLENDKFIEIKLIKAPSLYLLRRIRDESHRFAQKYHHKLVSMYVKSGNSN